jgi:hypothetical protein
MLITHFGNWAFIAFVVALKFLVDFCMHLLDVTRVNNLGLFSLQTHLKLAQELLPMVVVSCVSPLEHLVESP